MGLIASLIEPRDQYNNVLQLKLLSGPVLSGLEIDWTQRD